MYGPQSTPLFQQWWIATAAIAATVALASAVSAVINNAIDLNLAIALHLCLGCHHSCHSRNHCLLLLPRCHHPPAASATLLPLCRKLLLVDCWLFYTFTSTAWIGRCHRRCRRRACWSANALPKMWQCEGCIVCEPEEVVFIVIVIVIIVIVTQHKQNSPLLRQHGLEGQSRWRATKMAWTIMPALFLGLTFGIAYKWQYQRQTSKKREGGGGREIKHNTWQPAKSYLGVPSFLVIFEWQENNQHDEWDQHLDPMLMKLDPIWGYFACQTII
jgi:hypothetical protein